MPRHGFAQDKQGRPQGKKQARGGMTRPDEYATMPMILETVCDNIA